MQAVGQRNPQIVTLLLQEERKLHNPDFLAEARKPNSSTSQLLDRSWKEIPQLTDGQEVRSAIKACQTLAEKIVKTTPNFFSETFTLMFQDGQSLKITYSQLLPLLADSPVLKTMLEGSFKEGHTKEASLETLSKETFEILLKYTHSNSDLLLTSPILLDVLEAGFYLMNTVIIHASTAKLNTALKEKNWINTINPERLIDLTLNHPSYLLHTAKVMHDVIYNSFWTALNETFERLRNSTPSIFNFYVSSFEVTLIKWNDLIQAIQRIQTSLHLKEDLNQIIHRKLRQLHFDHNYHMLLGTVENTVKILEGLLNAGYPSTLIKDLMRECTDDLTYYNTNNPELMKAWLAAIQKGDLERLERTRSP